MKKITLITALILALLICLAACNQATPSHNTSSDGEASAGALYDDATINGEQSSEESSAADSPEDNLDDTVISVTAEPAPQFDSLEDIFRAVSSAEVIKTVDTYTIREVLDYLDDSYNDYFWPDDPTVDPLYVEDFLKSDKVIDIEIPDIDYIDSAIFVNRRQQPTWFGCYVIKLKDGADTNSIKEQIFNAIYDGIDVLSKFGVGAAFSGDTVMVVDCDNIVFVLFGDEDETKAYEAAFREVMGSGAGEALYK